MDELKLKLVRKFEFLMLDIIAKEDAEPPSQELHDVLREFYLRGASDALELTKQ